MRIESCKATDADTLTLLLRSSGLPVDDLTPRMLEDFLLARGSDGVTGVAGIEQYGDTALLRSVAVDLSQRGTGLGTQLVEAMEKRAAERGVTRLYLLTTTADAFFAARGYRPAARESAPAAIRATSQFSEQCPVSSAFMMKELD